jgi:hypothetical protein
MVAGAANATAMGITSHTEQLGERDVDGVRATGSRTVTTIPPGAVGNQLAIEVTNERWYSPDLQVVVMTRRVDPRFGETTYRLTNIVRLEPSADLFEIPSDFRVESPAEGSFDVRVAPR